MSVLPRGIVGHLLRMLTELRILAIRTDGANQSMTNEIIIMSIPPPNNSLSLIKARFHFWLTNKSQSTRTSYSFNISRFVTYSHN